MSGSTARRGFRFQDAYLLHRVFTELQQAIRDAWETGRIPDEDWGGAVTTRFGVEAKPRSGDTESDIDGWDWDVFVEKPDRLELAEVKSGEIDRDDARVFWRRLRNAVAFEPNGAFRLVPVLVADPKNLDGELRWNGLAQQASIFTGVLPTSEPARVASSAQMLVDALWWMCAASDQDAGSPACALDTALEILRRFRIDRYPAEQLSNAIFAQIVTLFPDGPTEAFRLQAMAWVNDRATDSLASRFFSTSELLSSLHLLDRAVALNPGDFKRWREWWADWPQLVAARSSRRLGESGEVFRIAEAQPALARTLAVADPRKLVVLGPAGQGKSGVLAEVAESQAQAGALVLWCGLTDLSAVSLPDVENSIRFRLQIERLASAKRQLWLLCDGLDEAAPPEREPLAKMLGRLGTLPDLNLVVTVRDGLWRAVPSLTAALPGFATITLADWPEATVAAALALPLGERAPSQRLLTLLRKPILLDLFWRTFVEAPARVSGLSQITTRHGLMVAFRDRLARSTRAERPRPADLAAVLDEVCARCAATVGAFTETGLDEEGIDFLVLESLLVREASHRPRLAFRHPLLRDFALAQYCLNAGSAVAAVERWQTIRGSIERAGCLRAILEALANGEAPVEHPGLPTADFIAAFVSLAEAEVLGLARGLGEIAPTEAMDPSVWPLVITSKLPPRFAGELFLAAQHNLNATWAYRVQFWSAEARWYDRQMPEHVLRYAAVLWEQREGTPEPKRWAAAASLAAAKLRHWSELPSFAEAFHQHNRWLKGTVIGLLSKLDPSPETLACIERELPIAEFHSRREILSALPRLASVDASWAAHALRAAISLILDEKGWHCDENLLAQHQHELFSEPVLSGDPGSLLVRQAPHFLPLLVDLVEALWPGFEKERLKQWQTFRAELGEAVENDFAASAADRDVRAGELIDDNPLHHYWLQTHYHDRYSASLASLHKAMKHLRQHSPHEFVTLLSKRLLASPLASVRSLLFDVVITESASDAFQQVLIALMRDRRLYPLRAFAPWLERGLLQIWPSASDDLRFELLELIELSPLADQLLCRLPTEDLDGARTDRVVAWRVAGEDEMLALPSAQILGTWRMAKPDECETPTAPLRPHWIRDGEPGWFLTFYEEIEAFRPDAQTEGELADALPALLKAAQTAVTAALAEPDRLNEQGRRWLVGRLKEILQARRRLLRQNAAAISVLPASLAPECATIAYSELQRAAPVDAEDRCGDLWREALALLDIALLSPPLDEDEDAQLRFEHFLVQTFRSGLVERQRAIAAEVRRAHWVLNEHASPDESMIQRRAHDEQQ